MILSLITIALYYHFFNIYLVNYFYLFLTVLIFFKLVILTLLQLDLF